MKFNLTPFNIIGILSLGTAIYFGVTQKNSYPNMEPRALLVLFSGALLGITLVLDVIFRMTIKHLRKIWITEILITLVAVILSLVYLQ